MSKIFALRVLVWVSLVAFTVADNGFFRCNCDYDGFWSVETIMECQKVGDFLIAVAYFSIPIELLYFVSCSNAPFKLILVEFIAFIVLCGMTHLLMGWTYYGQHSFHLMLALTIFKVLTALVSFATAITLVSLIPLLLKVKVREFMLKKKAWDLGREVGMIKKQKEAGWHVRMLTREIRKSLDRHTILYTTLIELSKTLDLHNCAIWMPNEEKTEMELTHEVRGRSFLDGRNFPIPVLDPVVQEIKQSVEVKLLDPDTPLAVASSGGVGVCEPGSVAAIRMPMLRVANFKGGTPELVPQCYAILVLVIPAGQGRCWGNQEMGIVKVVADQVAVAISHAAVLEEVQNMRDKLEEQNRALHQAQQGALRASQARNSFQMVMSNGMRRPMHSILGLLSVLQDEQLNPEQKLLRDALSKTSNVLSTLINDAMDTSTKHNGRFQLEMRSFQLHSMIKEAICLAKCLCAFKGYEFAVEVDKSLPNHVIGNEIRVFQVILHMVGNLLKNSGGGCIKFSITREGGNDLGWRKSSSEYVHIKFEIGIVGNSSQPEGVYKGSQCSETFGRREVEEVLSFTVCKKLVQLMQGNISVVPNPKGFHQSMAVVLAFHLGPSTSGMSGCTESSSYTHPSSLLPGLEVLLADHDGINRGVTRRLLEKLGCNVSAVSTGYECLGALGTQVCPFQVVLLDLHLPDLDGFEVAMRIRKFRSGSWPLIIALTANDDEDASERCIQVGMNGIIRKPVILQGIADELTRVLLLRSRSIA
ncbi:PREDICTED: ethylene receptor 2-like [Ipomoea nil]|uniref:ethylene receptor 2-like n=1 Tax=Ipomoea nil TaxID=35883 RepID=UPI000900CCD9|nr:PREDICTED: ethylene receptor 2-like [Ipomoea nil]